MALDGKMFLSERDILNKFEHMQLPISEADVKCIINVIEQERQVKMDLESKKFESKKELEEITKDRNEILPHYKKISNDLKSGYQNNSWTKNNLPKIINDYKKQNPQMLKRVMEYAPSLVTNLIEVYSDRDVV